MKKQFITEATRLQKLAGIITESQLLKENTFSTPEELADFLNQHKEEFFKKFLKDVIMYVIDAFGPFESNGEDADQEWFEDNWDNDLKDFVKKHWMKPEMKFKRADLDTGEGYNPIVTISWPGSDTDVDMSGYPWFKNTPDVDTSFGGDKTVSFLGRKFWFDYD
jgi:hypothetical protein